MTSWTQHLFPPSGEHIEVNVNDIAMYELILRSKLPADFLDFISHHNGQRFQARNEDGQTLHAAPQRSPERPVISICDIHLRSDFDLDYKTEGPDGCLELSSVGLFAFTTGGTRWCVDTSAAYYGHIWALDQDAFETNCSRYSTELKQHTHVILPPTVIIRDTQNRRFDTPYGLFNRFEPFLHGMYRSFTEFWEDLRPVPTTPPTGA
jgi:hypothetical protein